MDSTAERHDVVLPWCTARRHNNARLMMWRHRRRHMKARQMHTTYRMARRHIVSRATRLAKYFVNFKGHFVGNNAKSESSGSPSRLSVSPDNLLRSPDHPLDNLTYFSIWRMFFCRNMSETLTCQKLSTCWQFTEYICPDEFLGALFHLNRHFRRNSHGTHSKWVYDNTF
jgi:hypothetical protein